MPEIRTARIRTSEPAGAGFHTLVCEMESALEILPGQWGAFHTEIPNPLKPGEVLKRAWSFSEIAPTTFRLFVATVGPGTDWLAAKGPGDVLRFTGPWGARFRLDSATARVTFFAAGSGISPLGSMIDACVASGRPVRLLWEIPAPAMTDRLERWRAHGVELVVAPRLDPKPDDSTWWMAGDGVRLDEILPRFALPPERVERFFTPKPQAKAVA